MEIRNEINKILQEYKSESPEKTIDSILRLFSVKQRYAFVYLDGHGIERNTEFWANSKTDALRELEKICPKATNIFITRL